MVAEDREIEVAEGVKFPAWVYNGFMPGPTLRANVGDHLVIHFRNQGSKPHTMHFHGVHPANMDGVFEVVPAGKSFTYEFIAEPFGVFPYHCHMMPLRKHIARGLYGTLIVDPGTPRPPATEMIMVMHGLDVDFDMENEFYAVNGVANYYAEHPIGLKIGEKVRIYLSNMTEFDLVNNFHLHANMFEYLSEWHFAGAGGTDRHDQPVPGPTRHPGVQLQISRHVYVPRTYFGIRRAGLDGLLRRERLDRYGCDDAHRPQALQGIRFLSARLPRFSCWRV